MSLMPHNYVGPAHRTEYYMTCCLLVKHTEALSEWGSSPLQENHPGLSFIRGGERESVALLSCVSLSPHLELLTPLDYTTDYSLSIHSTDDKEWLLKKIPASSMQGPHSSHLHYWGVYVSLIFLFKGIDRFMSEWVMLCQGLLKLLLQLFQLSYLPKSINLDALIYNKSIMS